MDKQAFLSQLRRQLSGLPHKEAEERLVFYSEMIEDRKEEGLSEEEAVAAVGSVEEIAADIPGTKTAKHKRHPKAWEIVLLALGSPIWLSLGIAAAAVILALYISLWAVILSLWACFGALAGCSVAGTASGLVVVLTDNPLAGTALICAGVICAGLSIFMFFGCKAATNGTVLLTKKVAARIRSCFIRKEETQ